MIGHDSIDIVAPDGVPVALDGRARLAAGEPSVSAKIALRHADGTVAVAQVIFTRKVIGGTPRTYAHLVRMLPDEREIPRWRSDENSARTRRAGFKIVR